MSDAQEHEGKREKREREREREERKKGMRAQKKTKGRSRGRNYFFASGHWTMESSSPLFVALFLVSISLRVFYFVGTIFIRRSLTRVQLFSSIRDFCETTRVWLRSGWLIGRSRAWTFESRLRKIFANLALLSARFALDAVTILSIFSLSLSFSCFFFLFHSLGFFIAKKTVTGRIRNETRTTGTTNDGAKRRNDDKV